MDSLALCLENFLSFTEMLGESPAGDLFRTQEGSVAGASGVESAGENYALFRPGATEEELSSVISFFGVRRLPFAVPVFPGLDDKFCRTLSRHDIEKRHEYTAMSLPLAGVSRAWNGGLFQARPADKGSVAEWGQTVWLGFGDTGRADAQTAKHAAYLASCPANSLYYLKIDGSPVCAGLLHKSANCCGLYYFATPPEYRRRGYAGRLLAALAAKAAEGADELVLLATSAGRPVYEKFGFQPLAPVPVRMKGME